MGKRTKGTITVEIEIDSNGHKDSSYYLEMIEKKILKLKCVRKAELVGDSLAHGNAKPQKKDKIRELNDIRKIIKKAMPEGAEYKLQGRTRTMAFYLLLNEQYCGTISIEGGSLTIKDGYRHRKDAAIAIEIPMADPDFFDKFREAMKAYYDLKTGVRL